MFKVTLTTVNVKRLIFSCDQPGERKKYIAV